MQAFPEDFLEFCVAAGVDPHHPSEVCHYARTEAGRHLYGGWFHLVGDIVSGRDGWRAAPEGGWTGDFEQVTADFSVGLSARTSLVPNGFPNVGAVQLDFSAYLPWGLAAPEAD